MLATAEKEAAEARAALAMEASYVKSEFLANVSHELRTPLSSIIGFAELMYQGMTGPVTEDQKEYLGDILDCGRHLGRGRYLGHAGGRGQCPAQDESGRHGRERGSSHELPPNIHRNRPCHPGKRQPRRLSLGSSMRGYGHGHRSSQCRTSSFAAPAHTT